jgi:hypothetical protein
MFWTGLAIGLSIGVAAGVLIAGIAAAAASGDFEPWGFSEPAAGRRADDLDALRLSIAGECLRVSYGEKHLEGTGHGRGRGR